MNNNNQPINIDLRTCQTLECECGNIFFEKDIIIKVVPGIMIGTTGNHHIPVDILRCRACGKILDEYEPLISNPKN